MTVAFGFAVVRPVGLTVAQKLGVPELSAGRHTPSYGAWLPRLMVPEPKPPKVCTLTVMSPGLVGHEVTPLPIQVHRDNTEFHGSDEEFLRDFPVPGIQRAGGWSAVEKILGR